MAKFIKIVATIGPATWDPEILKEIFNRGVQIARINASFADYAEIKRVTSLIRDISPKTTVLLDTMGHKIRVAGFEEPRQLTEGKDIIIVSEGKSQNRDNYLEITYPHLFKDIKPGAKILLDDGNLVLEVIEIDEEREEVLTRIIVGGVLQKRKTVNTPGTHLHFPELPVKDLEDIKAGVEIGVDMIAASFVRDKNDIIKFKEAVNDPSIKIIAKIEDVEGVQNFDEILKEVDGIMVARGDLGVEIPFEKVPALQKEFVLKCRNAGKLAIVATQMLESMREHPRPTRAETTDVFTAVLDGADAVMLSAETSTGKYPIEAVTAMSTIAEEAVKYLTPQPVDGRITTFVETDKLCMYIDELANMEDIQGIIVLSRTGKTIRSLARHRNKKPIWAVVPSEKLARQMTAYFGVTAFPTTLAIPGDRQQITINAIEFLVNNMKIDKTGKIIIISGVQVDSYGQSSTLEIVDIATVLKNKSKDVPN